MVAIIMQVGDEIVCINGLTLSESTHEEVVNLICPSIMHGLTSEDNLSH